MNDQDQLRITVIEREVEIRYDLSVSQLVAETIHPWYASKDVSDNDLPEAIGRAERKIMKLVNMGIKISTEHATRILAGLGLRPATTKELLSLAMACPYRQPWGCGVIALGSEWSDPSGDRTFPALRDWADGRHLGPAHNYVLREDYVPGETRWDPYWYFAALEK